MSDKQFENFRHPTTRNTGNTGKMLIRKKVHHRFNSAPSCDHFGRHGEWKKYLATKILVKVANWRPTDLKRNLPEKLSKIG